MCRIETGGAIPLGVRLFRSRVQLLTHVQQTPDLDLDAALSGSLTTELHGEVVAMNRENFIVRMHLEAVERYREREAWEQLSDADHERLQREVAGLPSEIDTDEIESRMFDLAALRMQLALAEGNMGVYENHRQRMVEIAMLLEEKTTIPAVKAQLDYLASMQESKFWEGMNLNGLEELRLRLRGLMPFLDKKKRKIVYTDFEIARTWSSIHSTTCLCWRRRSAPWIRRRRWPSGIFPTSSPACAVFWKPAWESMANGNMCRS